MRTLADWLEACRSVHGHLCAGQVLGVRMSLLGCREVGIPDPESPAHRKSLVAWVEIDRCAADAVSTVTGCRLGKRTLKFADYGIQAATFLNTQTGRAVRVVAREDSRQAAARYFPDEENPRAQQFQAYEVMPESELFDVEAVRVDLPPEEQPGHPSRRAVCAACGVRVNAGREVVVSGGHPLCRPCAGGAYFRDLTGAGRPAR